MKETAYKCAQDANVPAHIKAALMRAWADLHEITMAIRGEGKPKPVEAKNAKPKSKSSNAAPVSERNGETTKPVA